ncbi:MAG TPA: CoA transferase [Acidimicrobiales bacterium]
MGELSSDPGWELGAGLGGAALAAFADAVGRGPAAPELAWTSAIDLLRERSEFTGWLPQGPVSAGGSARLLRSSDGWVAVSLPRLDDLDLLPAWLGIEPLAPEDDRVPWGELAAAVADRPGAWHAERAQELGLAVAVVPQPGTVGAPDEQLEARGTVDPSRPYVRTTAGPAVPAGRTPEGLLVVDLSSLWAGPTCARLLAWAGARVVKVESTGRADGARLGNREFYRRLHEGQEERSVPFDTAEGRAELRDLLEQADVVIEGSRPRALTRLGIDPHEIVAGHPGAVWLAITAHGRTGPRRQWVGFGDDAAAAGGLVRWGPDGVPAFVGDAVADPLTGLTAAALVAGAVRDGGGVVIDIALREVARAAALGATVEW